MLTSPAGEVFNQAMAHELARNTHLVIICGHYEGVDDRVREWRMRERSPSATTCSPEASYQRW